MLENPLKHASTPLAELLRQLQTDPKTGLSSSKIPTLRSIHGPNELPEPPSESLFSKIKEQFSDVLVIILLCAAVISFLTNILGDGQDDLPPWVEPAVIFLILIVNAIIGIYQDFNAENAIRSLHEINVSQANVLRDSIWQVVSSKTLVPGDIVKMAMGNKVPADLRIIEVFSLDLQIEQAILTGESQPVRKDTKPPADTGSIFDMNNLLFSGTLVVQGSALCVVVATGPKTQIGKIQQEVMQAGEEENETPLRKKLNDFGDKLAKVIGVLCIIIWAINARNFFDPSYGNWFSGALHYFKIAVSLAVAAIPEGLPAVITTCLALGTRRMSQRRALVRNLTSVETLGCTNVICTDKTGTLTSNEMTVKRFFLPRTGEKGELELQDHSVEGWDYALRGRVLGVDSSALPQYRRLCQCLTLNNDSHLVTGPTGRVSIVGLPMEGALRVLVEKLGHCLVKDEVKGGKEEDLESFARVFVKDLARIQTFEFTSERKVMTVVCEDPVSKSRTAFSKGGPEILLEKSSHYLDNEERIQVLDENKREMILGRVKSYSLLGFRCLGLAYRTDIGNGLSGGDIEQRLVFIGVVAMEDPPRPEVRSAIEKCRTAGIRLIMITGDLKETAQSIGDQIGFIAQKDVRGYCFTGREFDLMAEAEQETVIDDFLADPRISLIFCRAEPRHKRLLVQLLSRKNQIVAMTGDGVNDAPALRQADIGIAMGLSGTEVAKESSDMILADDNFGTIVKAIEEGRAIYDNMKAFIRYMISSNIGEVVSIFLGSVLGLPDIFSSVQLLWVNLVTDGLPAMALSFNKPDPDIMVRTPRHREDSIVNGWIFFRYMVIGTYVGLATAGVFVYWYLFYDWAEDQHVLVPFEALSNWGQCPNWTDFPVSCDVFTTGKSKASTLGLTVLVSIEMFNALNALSENNSILDVGIFDNPWLILSIMVSMMMHAAIIYLPGFQIVFQTSELSVNDWMLVVGCSFPVVLIDEVMKYFARSSARSATSLACCKND